MEDTKNIKRKMIAFHGHKGGAGRSLLLANLAYAIAAHGETVIVVDFDLEAPGLGDYFDTGIGDLSGKWRSQIGIFDLIEKRKEYFFQNLSEGEDLQEKISKGSILENALISVYPHSPHNKIRLLGAAQYDWTNQTPTGLAARILDYDWTAFIASDTGKSYIDTLGAALRNKAKFILIDTRTGYNYSSLLLLQIWSPLLILVSTPSWPSIDGLARMNWIFNKFTINTKIVLSKLSSRYQQSMGMPGTEANTKYSLIESLFKNSLFKDNKIPTFPFIEDMLDGDRLLLKRNTFWSRTKDINSEESKYLKSFSFFFKEVTGIDFDVNALKSLAEKEESKSVLLDSTIHTENTKKLTQRDANEAFPPSNMDDAIYDSEKTKFFKRVEDFCMIAPDTPTIPSAVAPGGDSGGPPYDEGTLNPVPSLGSDKVIQKWSIEYRERLRVDLAKKLTHEEKNEKNEENRNWAADRINDVKKENYITVLPIPPEEIIPPSKTVNIYLNMFQQVMLGSSIDTIPPRKKLENNQNIKLSYDLMIAVNNHLKFKKSNKVIRSEKKVLRIGVVLLRVLAKKRLLGPEANNDQPPLIPRNNDNLEIVNALDAFTIYVGAVRDLCLEEWNKEAIQQLDEVQKRVLECLAQIRDLDKATPRWHSHFRTAIFGRRLVWQFHDCLEADLTRRVPHSMATLLSAEESSSLAKVVGKGIQASDFENQKDLTADVPLASRTLSLAAIQYLSGQVQEALGLLDRLYCLVFSPNCTHPKNGEWRAFVQNLAGTIEAMGNSHGCSKLYRLLLRLGWYRRVSPNEQALPVSINLFRAGLPINDEGLIDIFLNEEEKNGRQSARNFRWWKAVRFSRSGARRHAHKALKKNGETNGKVEDAVWGWLISCGSRLGFPNRVLEDYLESWWRSRRGALHAFSDDEATWLSSVKEMTGAYLASGKVNIDLLEKAVEVAQRREAAGLTSDSILVALRIRLLVARLRQSKGTKRATLLKQRSGLEQEINTCKENAAKFGMLGADREFAEYLGMSWDEQGLGEGMFNGDEAPSPIRLFLAEMLVEYAEVLFYAGETKKLQNVAREIEVKILGKYDEKETTGFLSVNRLAYCYPIAAASALQYAASQSKGGMRGAKLLDRAKRHRDADLNANGSGRNKYYQRIFSICGIELPPFRNKAR